MSTLHQGLAPTNIDKSDAGAFATSDPRTSTNYFSMQSAPELLTSIKGTPQTPCLASILASWPLPRTEKSSFRPEAPRKSPPPQSFALVNATEISRAIHCLSVPPNRGGPGPMVPTEHVEQFQCLEKREDRPQRGPVSSTSSKTLQSTDRTSALSIEQPGPSRMNGVDMPGWNPQPAKNLLCAERPGKAVKTFSGSVSPKAWSSPKEITTFMLGNLPYRVTKKDIADALDAMGFEGAYRIGHLPTGGRSKARATNLGYAFICFADWECAAAFVDGFEHFCFSGRSSTKRCTLKLARLQHTRPDDI